MTTFVQVAAQSPWRLLTLTDSTFTGYATAGNYSISRADGLDTTIVVAQVISIDTITQSLALSDALIPDVIYLLGATGVTGLMAFSFRPVSQIASGGGPIDDPEAEAFGLDVDWLSPKLVSGDTPTIRGMECLRQDATAIAMTEPGELYHRPQDGAGLPKQVNGPASAGDLAARLKRQWLKDPRVRLAEPKVTIKGTGEVVAKADITPLAINLSLPVQVP